MNVRPLLITNSILVAAMAGVAGWAWQHIPADAQLPMHWNIHGEPDRFGGKAEALLFMPALAAVITAVLCVLPYIDPRRANIEASGKFWNATGIAVMALLAYVYMFIVLAALGRAIDIGDYLVPALSLLFIVIGNYISKTRSNFFAGVRTPWTLSSDYSWNKTHRLASRLFVASGLVSLGFWFIVSTKVAIVVLFVALLGSAILSVVASYFYWRADPTRGPTVQNGA